MYILLRTQVSFCPPSLYTFNVQPSDSSIPSIQAMGSSHSSLAHLMPWLTGCTGSPGAVPPRAHDDIIFYLKNDVVMRSWCHWCTGSPGALVHLVHWFTWCTGSPGALVHLVHLVYWCTWFTWLHIFWCVKIVHMECTWLQWSS